MRTFLLVVLVLAFVSVSTTVPPTLAPVVSAALPTAQPPKVLSIDELVTLYASKYGVSEGVMLRVMKCENRSRNPKKQSGHTYYFSDPRRNIVEGTQERSYGLVQIHLPDHPEVSYEQATDPEFSIAFLAKHLSLGHGWWWTCY